MDTDLVIRAQRGDQAAFATLAASVVERLLPVARSILGDAHLAEDAAQQALVNAWRMLPSLRDPARFEAWTYRLVVNACHSEARRSLRRLPNLATFEDVDPASPDQLGAVADRDQLERGFRRLSVDQRAVVVLHHQVGLTVEEVAATLGVPPGTVRSRLFHAMRGLRAALEADARPGGRERPIREGAR